MKKTSNVNEYCHKVFNIGTPHKKVLVSLLLSLTSESVKSVVELSESPFFGHSYSSLSQCIGGLSETPQALEQVLHQFQKLWLSHYTPSDRYVFQTDGTPYDKSHSEKLAERQYIKLPNKVIASDSGLGKGYNYSYVNVSYTPTEGGSRWSLPLSVKRIDIENDAISTAIRQIGDLMKQEDLPFKQANCIINVSDSGYGTARYISPLVEKYANMVQVVRLRHGNKVWQSATPKQHGAQSKGARPIYAPNPLYLIPQSDIIQTTHGKTKTQNTKHRTAIYDLQPTQVMEQQTFTSRGRALSIRISRWDNLRLRAEKQYQMRDKPFNLIGVQVADAQTGELVFDKPLFIAVFGKKRHELPTSQIYTYYRNRFDIEVHNRFCSQQLLANDFHTPDIQHFDNWLIIVAAAYWLLFIASKEVNFICKPWERYLTKNKLYLTTNLQNNTTLQLSVAQTKKATKPLFRTLDLKPFAPKSVNNGSGRKMGTKLTKRPDAKVLKKSDFANKTRNNQ